MLIFMTSATSRTAFALGVPNGGSARASRAADHVGFTARATRAAALHRLASRAALRSDCRSTHC